MPGLLAPRMILTKPAAAEMTPGHAIAPVACLSSIDHGVQGSIIPYVRLLSSGIALLSTSIPAAPQPYSYLQNRSRQPVDVLLTGSSAPRVENQSRWAGRAKLRLTPTPAIPRLQPSVHAQNFDLNGHS